MKTIMFSENHGSALKTMDPSTGEEYKRYKLHTKKEAEELVQKTHEAFMSWRETSLDERSKIIMNMGKLIADNKNELAAMMSHQMGKTLSQAKQEVDLCAGICEYTAKIGPEQLKDEKRELDAEDYGIISYQPLGVILGMQPWNFPLYQCVRYSAAVIMGGNTTIFKHSEICFETAAKIEELFLEAGLPKNVFTPIYVKSEIADELIAHELVKGVTFTGSASIGKKIAEESGKHLKKTVLELGGSDPYIVLEDADIDQAVETCVQGRIYNNGQTCVNAKRFIVLDAVYDEFRDKFVAAMEKVTFGNPSEGEFDMGPISKKKLREKLSEQVKDTVKKGAKVLCGGKIPEGEGYFYPATVLEDIPKGTPAYDDELFGPVASLFRAKNLSEALKIANEHRYGLGGGIFSKDNDKAIRIAREKMDTGMINVNTYGAAKPNMPFGGVRESGYGREHGGFGIKEFVNIKSVYVNEL